MMCFGLPSLSHARGEEVNGSAYHGHQALTITTATRTRMCMWDNVVPWVRGWHGAGVVVHVCTPLYKLATYLAVQPAVITGDNSN